jgi:hypothetical protein
MSKQKIYAVQVKNGVGEIARKEIGVAVLDEGRISAAKYNELKRAALKAFPRDETRGSWCVSIVTEDGRKDTFGGYPADVNVMFE